MKDEGFMGAEAVPLPTLSLNNYIAYGKEEDERWV
jgi:hypothetical protein